MSTASPSAFLLWAILFNCLRWSSGRQPGAFKRVMTYSYLSSVPLLVLYSIATTVIKFKEGFVVAADNKIIPRPLDFYSPQAHSWIIPLNFVFSIAWSLELVTHLEELAFWLYLLHQKPQKEEWFSSWEYRLWYLGSMIGIIGMPLTALITRKDVNTCDAYIFLVGSAGSTITTICFLYVLWRFPGFIRHVKAEGADPSVVVRLATFYQLNLARVVFRFLFTIPLLVIALDGIIDGPHNINKNVFWADFLHMIAGIGCFVSTCITLLIFFPRSITSEAGYRPKAPTLPNSPKSAPITPPFLMSPQTTHMPSTSPHPTIPISTLQHETEEWDVYSISPSDASHYPNSDQVPPYPHQPQYIPSTFHPAVHLQGQSQGILSQYRPQPPDSTAYQRHPFPHSLSSPHIFSPPGSPQQIRIPTPQSPQRASYKHHSRRVSAMSTPDGASDATVGLGIGTPQFDDRGQQGTAARPRPLSQGPPSSVTVRPPSMNLHPYVMTFTSPIDLTDIPPRDPFPRSM
ncbi:unnamed protein product [Somion occarium]|uniref:Transmembrane protein n=1 Tax=Somion occarium TaxID=3059160 RepID=A0ABP1DV17_9APHY